MAPPDTASSILHTQIEDEKLNLAQAPDMHAPKTVTLQTISENHPLTTNSPDSSKLRREITALRKQCEILEAQRNDAFEALDKLASAPQDHVSAYVAKIKDLESQRNDALEEIDQLASAPQEQNQVYLAKIKELATTHSRHWTRSSLRLHHRQRRTWRRSES
jgi:chromosome segregation ATPase